MEEEEAMPIPVQETPLTTCPPPSTAASIANLEYPEELWRTDINFMCIKLHVLVHSYACDFCISHCLCHMPVHRMHACVH